MVRSYTLGVNAYVVKPVDFHEFVNAVKELGVFWALINEPPPGSVKKVAVTQSPLRILLLEDNAADAQLIRDLLEGGSGRLRADSRSNACRVRSRSEDRRHGPDPRGLQSSVVRRHFGIEDRARRAPRSALHLRVGHSRRGSGDRSAQDRGDGLCSEDQLSRLVPRLYKHLPGLRRRRGRRWGRRSIRAS